jgi:hypothetical protein
MSDERLVLDAADSKVLAGALLNPPEPNEALVRAANRIADALFRQAKASERSVALQEELVESQRQMARSSALLEQALIARQPAIPR